MAKRGSTCPAEVLAVAVDGMAECLHQIPSRALSSDLHEVVCTCVGHACAQICEPMYTCRDQESGWV